jgi:hypothetical protein
MKRTRNYRMLAVMLGMLAGLALSACSSTPLPPLFLQGPARSAQPAAPVAQVVATPAEAPTAAPVTVAVAIPPTAASAEGIAGAAPITASVVITPADAPTRAAELAVLPTATRVAPTATRVAPTATRVAPTATRVAPTATRVAPTATRVAPAATRAPARPAATPTPEWPRTLVITADDIEQGASSVPGLQISGLDVQFGNDTMTMSFDSLRYSFVSLRDVTVEGRFTVSNCNVDFVADSISPRNLATSAIPGFINQALDQQLGAWCVEAVTIQPGQLVASVRPRS